MSAVVTSELRLAHLPVDSPFVPDTTIQYAWDSVSLTTALSCAQRYKYGIIDGWTPKNPGIAIALAFGLLIHAGGEQYHHLRSRGVEHEAAVDGVLWHLYQQPDFAKLPVIEDVDEASKVLAEAEEADDGITVRNAKVRTRYHLFRALVWYFEQYRNDPFKTIILADGKPAVEHSFRIDIGQRLSDGHALMVSGHIDRLVEFNDDPYVTDYKTGKAISRQWQEDFKLSHQMTGYTLGGKLGLAQPVKGVFIDAFALQIGGVNFARFPTYRSKGQLAEYIQLVAYVGEQAERWYASGFYPKNDKACYFCEFKQICSRDPSVRAGYLNQFYERKPAWNPLASR